MKIAYLDLLKNPVVWQPIKKVVTLLIKNVDDRSAFLNGGIKSVVVNFNKTFLVISYWRHIINLS